MEEMMNEMVNEEAVAAPVYENTYTEPAAQPYYPEQPQISETADDSTKVAGLVIAGAAAVGYAVGACVEKVKTKIAAKQQEKKSEPAPAKKRWAFRNPFYRVEEPVAAPAPQEPVQNQDVPENNPEQK